ncbi:DUF1343 domain-containing protein [Maribacter sp.]|uniref:exo-beta-N-acetylmuramidase NamZ family protein n=1 Tax=Maribacter sp. TaxID=1897614 RepID=UPI0025BC0A1A|nr:DUF1343 domain-containing protein [Maribacter sp.]
MKKVLTGLDVLKGDNKLVSEFKGNVALLCHNASVDANCQHATFVFQNLFKNRFVKIFGPQHGFSTDAQDNMIETDHTIHPFFNIPVYSLYSETRTPSDEMLEGIDHLFVDMQDVGCRMYTYIYTLTLLLEKCAEKSIEVIILDRPNPLNGETIAGNILDMSFSSFIGRHPMPVRHAMTMGEVAQMHQKFWVTSKANVRVIKMKNWQRSMYFGDTKIPWLLPSPNLARTESVFTFPSTVLFEGTELSEGRGTTQPLEIIGSPKIEPFSFYHGYLSEAIKKSKLKGFVARPIAFLPTFQKHYDKVCGGIQIHVTDRKLFEPWRTGLFLLKEFRSYLGDDFKWKQPPYEYNCTQMPIDIINGTDKLRNWVENNESVAALNSFEHLDEYKRQLQEIKLYE